MERGSSFRIYDRYKPKGECRAKLIHADEVTIKNISLGGLLIETTRRLNLNQGYKIQMLSHKGNSVITPRCVVTRAFLRRLENDLPVYEIALKFINLTNDEEAFLKNIFSNISNEK